MVIYVDKSGQIVLFPFLLIENDWKWFYQLLPIKYELKLPSESTPTSFAIQNQIQEMCVSISVRISLQLLDLN